MRNTANPFEQVLIAQTRNSTLTGEALRALAQSLSGIAKYEGLSLMAADAPGERIIGAALAQDGSLNLVDTSRRLDQSSVLLVAGYLAGTAGLAVKARLARSLGAARVEAAFVNDSSVGIDACDHVWPLMSRGACLVAL